jgi:hypothetical protein
MDDRTRGMYRKFSVERTDGSSREGGKHERCEYFVLDWNHDPYAVPAMRAYVQACRETHPELARDIEARIDQALLSRTQSIEDIYRR